MWGLSLVAASGGHSSLRCAGLLLSRPLLLRSTGSRCTGSAIVAHGPSRSVACGILPDQGTNPCPLHWQADSQPLRHQGSPWILILLPCLGHCSAAMNIEVHVSFLIKVFVFSGYISRSGIAGSYGNSIYLYIYIYAQYVWYALLPPEIFPFFPMPQAWKSKLRKL